MPIPSKTGLSHHGSARWLIALAAIAIVAALGGTFWLQYAEANRFRERFCADQLKWSMVEYNHPNWIDRVWTWWHGPNALFAPGPPFLPWFDRVQCEQIDGFGELDREWFQDASRVAGVRRLYFEDCTFEVNDLALLSEHRDVVSVVFVDTPLTDSGLRCLHAIGRLRELSLERTSVTDAGLAECVAFREMERLSVDSPDITGTGLRSLRAIPGLRELSLRKLQWTEEGFDALGALASVDTMEIEAAQWNDHALTSFGLLRSLRTLSADDCAIDGSIEPLAALGNLESLDFFGCRTNGADLAPLSRLRLLRSVSFGDCDVTDDQIRALAALPGLRALWLFRTQVRGTAFREPGWTELRTLDLDGTELTDEDLDSLANLPAIEELRLDRTRVTEEGVQRLKRIRPRWKIKADDLRH